MKIEQLSNCQVCDSTNLIQRHLIMEDLRGDISEKFVKICKDCDTLHYIHNDIIQYEFSLKIEKSYKPIKVEKDEFI